MKDWKAECDELRGQVKELRQQVAMYRSQEERRFYEDKEVRNKFKELLIEVLGK